MVVGAGKVAGMWLGWWLHSGFCGFRWWLDLLLNNFGSMLGSCTKWAIFCNVINDECSLF